MSRAALRARLVVVTGSLLIAVTVGVVLVYGSAGGVGHAHHGDAGAGATDDVVLGVEPESSDVVPFDGVADAGDSADDPNARTATDSGGESAGSVSRTDVTRPDRPGAFGPAIPETRAELRLEPDGSPVQGYDPALLPQPELAAVVAQPHGNARDVAGASGVPRDAAGEEIIHEVVVDGCHLDYGEGFCTCPSPTRLP